MSDNELSSDAGKMFNSLNVSVTERERVNVTSTYFAIIEQLQLVDIKSAMFLLMDVIGIKKYISLKEKDEFYVKEKFKETLNDQARESLVEILIIMKKFKLLKQLGICKHVILPKESNYINPFWNLLYEICENLDNHELQNLKKLFCLRLESSCAEDVFAELCNSQIISENRLQSLREVLEKLQRSDLLQKLNKFINAKENAKKYYIRDPKPNQPCGLAIIINQQAFQQNLNQNLLCFEDRMGSQVDKENLENLWRNFGFKTIVQENLSAEEIGILFSNLPIEHSNQFDIFVACLLSHGDENVIYGSDCQELAINSLINTVDACRFLNGKPKLFFIQACQGKSHHPGLSLNSGNPYSFESDSIPEYVNETEIHNGYLNHSDQYLAIATVPGYVSYRSPTCGSLFVTKLVEYLEKYGIEEDLELIMQKVKLSLSEGLYKQMPITLGTLRRSVMFKRLHI